MREIIKSVLQLKLANAAIKVVLLTLLVVGKWPTLIWLARKTTHRADAIIIVIFLSASFVLISSISSLNSKLYAARPALVIIALSLFAGILNSLTIGMHQINLMLFILSIYGWFGLNKTLWPHWASAMNVVVLMAVGIPFYLEFSSGFGFSLRLLTASVVEQTLQSFGINAISYQDIIITENAIAHVDIPCSGLKSLWVGSAFFLIALTVLRVKISLNTTIKYCAFMTMLLSANMFRVLVLTVLTAVYNFPKTAEILHVPLGVALFSINCGAAWLMLGICNPIDKHHFSSINVLYGIKAKYFLCIIAGLASIQIAVTINDRSSSIHNDKLQPINLSSPTMQLRSISLTEGEKSYFSRSEKTIARKWGFKIDGKEGTVILVQSLDLNMFHAPELCMAANGIVIDSMETISISPERQIRVMSLNNGTATGIYWLQQGDYTTDNFGKRYWKYLFSRNREWQMFSMIINNSLDSNSHIIKKIIEPFYYAASVVIHEKNKNQ